MERAIKKERKKCERKRGEEVHEGSLPPLLVNLSVVIKPQKLQRVLSLYICFIGIVNADEIRFFMFCDLHIYL